MLGRAGDRAGHQVGEGSGGSHVAHVGNDGCPLDSPMMRRRPRKPGSLLYSSRSTNQAVSMAPPGSVFAELRRVPNPQDGVRGTRWTLGGFSWRDPRAGPTVTEALPQEASSSASCLPGLYGSDVVSDGNVRAPRLYPDRGAWPQGSQNRKAETGVPGSPALQEAESETACRRRGSAFPRGRGRTGSSGRIGELGG